MTINDKEKIQILAQDWQAGMYELVIRNNQQLATKVFILAN